MSGLATFNLSQVLKSEQPGENGLLASIGNVYRSVREKQAIITGNCRSSATCFINSDISAFCFIAHDLLKIANISPQHENHIFTKEKISFRKQFFTGVLFCDPQDKTLTKTSRHAVSYSIEFNNLRVFNVQLAFTIKQQGLFQI